MKILIVGAGFSGSVFAHQAAIAGHYVTIIDKRNHIGGNAYSYKDEESDVEVHKYGPHIFHTNSKRVWVFINQFSEFNNYVNRVKALSGRSIYSLPINLGTINQFFGKTFSPSEAKKFIKSIRVNKKSINNLEDFVLASVGKELYEAFYKYYSIKQWDTHPKNIPLSTAKRLPIRYTYDDNYFNHKYQGIPKEGYTIIFKRMLDHKNIKIQLDTDFKDYKDRWRKDFDYLVFSGSLDNYYNYEMGELPYRTVRFEEIREKEIQGNAVINYTDNSEAFTRIHEHKWFTPEKSFSDSIGFKEYSSSTTSKKEPYYPVKNDNSISLLNKYKKLATNETNVIFLGRLAKYEYYDMDQVIASSLSTFMKWSEEHAKGKL